ncbi:MAG: lipopolysaccharide biosynthesis protein, partial [Cetobacterium sp.]
SQAIGFVLLIGLFYIKQNSIIILSVIYGASIFISHLIMTTIYFKKNKNFFFRYKDVNFSIVNDIFGIGIKIFLIQVSALIIFSSDNIIITKYVGIDSVAEYNIVNKLFGIPLIIINIITVPIWPAVTKAFHEKNKNTIIKLLSKLKKIFLVLLILTIGITFISQKFIIFWTLNEIDPRIELIISCAIATLLNVFSNIYLTLIYGIEVKWELVFLSWIQAVINIVVSIIAIKYFHLGAIGVVLGTCFSMLTNVFILPKSLKCLLNEI